jgi:hypothetical protein
MTASPPNVAIFVYRHGSLDDSSNYLLREIASEWRDQGCSVSVVRGPGPKIDADIVFNHVDLTVLPPDHVAYLRLYPRVINGAVVDISKRLISRQTVRPGDGYGGPVIAKANLNAAGSKEAELALRGFFPPAYARVFDEYQVFDSPSDVPDDYWRSSGIVVERFLVERIDDFYCLRTWVFLGDQESNSLSYANVPIVKQRDVVRRDVVPEVPEALRRMREELGFDYGKFDYALIDGEVVLYDVNRTPTLGAFSREEFLPRVRHYAAGLASLL